MKGLLCSLVTIVILALPVGLTTELISVYGPDALARNASSDLREQYLSRQQLTRKLVSDRQISPSSIDDWEWQALRSLNEPLPLELPYAEQWLLFGSETQVITFDISATQNRILEITSDRQPTAQGGMFVEIFEPMGERHRVVATSNPTDTHLRWPVSRTGTYRIRVQSLPGSVGAFALTLDEQFAFEFPVATDSPKPVQSFFGMPRDGGRREHHGIDIFAPRHTPVVAATDGYIARVATSTRGGLHIWQRGSDEYGNPIGSLYYAHLEDTHVSAGTWVNRGTQIGTVGNSGNAISTPPHLHFGLYQRSAGPQDPLPWTGLARQATLTIPNGHRWPAWVSIARESVNVRTGPGTEYAVETTIDGGELVALQAATSGWLRVRTGSGVSGFLADTLVDPPTPQPITLQGPTQVQASPDPSSPILIELVSGTVAARLGRFGNARLVQTESGLQGWIIDPVAITSDERPS